MGRYRGAYVEKGPQLQFHLSAGSAALGGDKEHAAHHIALGEDRRRHRQTIAIILRGYRHAAAAVLVAVGVPLVHDLGQGLADGLVQQLPPPAAGDGDHRIPIADRGDGVCSLAQAVADLPGKFRQLPHGGVFLEDQLTILVRENLQRVTLADTHGAADLLGDHHPAEVVDPAHDSGCFHMKNPPVFLSVVSDSICRRVFVMQSEIVYPNL